MFPLTHSLVRASSIRGAFSNYHQGGRLLIIGGGGGGRRIQTSSDRGGLIESTPRNVWVLVVPGGVVKNWRFHASNVRTPPPPPRRKEWMVPRDCKIWLNYCMDHDPWRSSDWGLGWHPHGAILSILYSTDPDRGFLLLSEEEKNFTCWLLLGNAGYFQEISMNF